MYFYEIQYAASDAYLVAGSFVTVSVGVASSRPPGTAIKDFYLLYDWSLQHMDAAAPNLVAGSEGLRCPPG